MTMSRRINSKALKAIMQKRSLVLKSQVGKRVVLTVQGEGSVIDVKDKSGNYVRSVSDDGSVFQKKIVNFRANSQLAMADSRNRQCLIDAFKAEKAGDVETANELFSKYLNATQLSMSIPLPSHKAHQCVSGVEVAGRVILVKTENGELLTIDPSSISIVEPERLNATNFELPGDDEEEVSEELTPAAGLSHMDRAALKTFIGEKGLEIRVTKSMRDEEIRSAIQKALNGSVVVGAEDDDF